MKIGHITLLVKNFDEALSFYVEKLGFQKKLDSKFEGGMRWVTISPKDQPSFEFTLVLADSEEKLNAFGKQAGDHVLMTLLTDDCKRDYKILKAKGVKFYGEPTKQMWDTEVVFEDLYGNLIDLMQRNKL